MKQKNLFKPTRNLKVKEITYGYKILLGEPAVAPRHFTKAVSKLT